MPPRVGTRAPLAAADALLSSSSRATTTTTTTAQQTCLFSTTAPCEKNTAARRRMYDWIKSRRGQELANAQAPLYVTGTQDAPFPNNPLFRSEPVVARSTKRVIYKKATEEGQPLNVIAAEMGLDVRRVAAIVRLHEAEKQWVADGKRTAAPYGKAVNKVLPKWSFDLDEPARNRPFEPVNDVHVHRYTMQQLFVPVAESRPFTRKHAAAAFHDGMLPTDGRSPQQGLIAMERRILESGSESRAKNWKAFEEEERERENTFAARLADRAAADEAATTRVKSDRYEFRFREMNADHAGTNGRSPKGLGWRYGAPHMDRKRGMIKIPTSVP